ncbi:MAG: glycosyltransferase family 39 protein, partial [Chloroflexota bacterium]
APAKLIAAINMPWDIDIVPVVERNVQYALTPIGTLSSVAAYNLPMLEWMHLPAQWLTGNVWWTIVLTLMVFNALGTLAVYALSIDLFDDKRAALVSAVFFTLSEVGVSSTYTAWAQLLLPTYFALVTLCLWWWYQREQGIWLALAGILATAAFMTHFSALLLYPAMLVFALLVRAKWQWGWLIAGAVSVLLLMMPYLQVQIERDFVDVRAFASQEVLVSDEVMASVQQYKPENQIFAEPTEIVPEPAPEVTIPEAQPTPDAVPNEPRPRWLRVVDYALEAPIWYLRAMTTAFDFNLQGIAGVNPTLGMLTTWLLQTTVLLYGVSIGLAVWQVVRDWRTEKTSLLTILRETPAGRLIVLVIFLTTMIALMIATRTIDNPTYWMGFMSVQWVMTGYALSLLPDTRNMLVVFIAIMLTYGGIQSADRILRVVQHDDSIFSFYNVGLYRHVSDTADYIAEDWSAENDADSLVVSYDILRENPNFWWVVAWNSIDDSYRIGMTFDFLLSYHHGLYNTNRNPVGIAEGDNQPDYIVIYSPALERYMLDDYEVTQFGTIVVLEPR